LRPRLHQDPLVTPDSLEPDYRDLVPVLVDDALAPGSLSRREQPRIGITDGLLARPWRHADATLLRQAFADPHIQRFHVRRIDSNHEALEWIAQWSERWERETDASWAVTSTDTDTVLGQIGFRALRLDEARAQISFWLAPDARGRGVATRATAAVTEWLLNELGLQRVGLAHSVSNGPSCRVAERAGFTFEGTLRRYGLHADGWHDMHMHARTAADDWPALTPIQ
jgi:RimJ/RimL family protein N-acetyltransferase